MKQEMPTEASTLVSLEPQDKDTKIIDTNLILSELNGISRQFDEMPLVEKQQFITGETLLNLGIDNIPTLFEGLIPKVGVWALVGASDTCKSMLLRQMAMCNAGGLPFMDRTCNSDNNRSIVVCSEDDEFAISFLLRNQNKSIKLTDKQASQIRFLFDTDDFIQKLETEMSATPASLIIIDAFGDLFDGKDLNQNNQVRSFLNKFTVMANRYKCSIGFLHHTGKRTEDLTPSKNNAIGSQGFEAKMRLVIELRLDRTESDLRHLCIVKGNYLAQEEKVASYVIKIDENLIFSATGVRVPFEELALNNGGEPAKNKKIEAIDLPNEAHFNFITHAFKLGRQLSKRDITEKIAHDFKISDQPARRFVDYYEEMLWIRNVSKNPKVFSYEVVK